MQTRRYRMRCPDICRIIRHRLIVEQLSEHCIAHVVQYAKELYCGRPILLPACGKICTNKLFPCQAIAKQWPDISKILHGIADSREFPIEHGMDAPVSD
jgi:hypothetical protein